LKRCKGSRCFLLVALILDESKCACSCVSNFLLEREAIIVRSFELVQRGMIHHPRIAIAMMVAGLLAQADVQRVDGREINAQNEEE